jgi:hypothetical protein
LKEVHSDQEYENTDLLSQRDLLASHVHSLDEKCVLVSLVFYILLFASDIPFRFDFVAAFWVDSLFHHGKDDSMGNVGAPGNEDIDRQVNGLWDHGLRV